MPKTKYVIFVPGLGDHAKFLSFAVNHWRNFGFEPIVYSMGWHDKKTKLDLKLNGLVDIVEKFSGQGNDVFLVGCSAGASAVLNVFCSHEDKINKVISICGRVRSGGYKGFCSLGNRAKSSLAFAESVKLFETRQSTLSDQDKKRIMTVTAGLGDELVPADTSFIADAYNITIPIIEHSVSIYAALTIFSGRLIRFLNG